MPRDADMYPRFPYRAMSVRRRSDNRRLSPTDLQQCPVPLHRTRSQRLLALLRTRCRRILATEAQACAGLSDFEAAVSGQVREVFDRTESVSAVKWVRQTLSGFGQLTASHDGDCK